MSEARPQDREPIEEPPTADEPAPAAPSHEERVRDLEDRLRRTEAEFVNETRRIRRQADEQGRYAAERVVVDLLPVLDALQGARSSLGEGADTAVVREGLDLVERQLADALARHGVERIEAEGLPFDPSCHEAMLMVDDPSRPAQTVAQVLRHGYRLHGRVVRPAQVVVARGGPAPERPVEEAPMPTYDYECEACGHRFEHFQSMSSKRLVTCPACKKRKLIRLVGSGAGVIFKGSGFYETDYKRAGSSPPKDTSTSSSETSKDTPSSSSEGAKTASDTSSKGGKGDAKA